MNDYCKKINEMIVDSLYKDSELESTATPPKEAILVNGLVRNYAFNPQRVLSKKNEIREILLKMPATFWKDSGGGWSFLNLCQDKEGILWGQHNDVEALICLAIATGQCEYCLPKELWPDLPGGVPYVVFK